MGQDAAAALALTQDATSRPISIGIKLSGEERNLFGKRGQALQRFYPKSVRPWRELTRQSAKRGPDFTA